MSCIDRGRMEAEEEEEEAWAWAWACIGGRGSVREERTAPGASPSGHPSPVGWHRTTGSPPSPPPVASTAAAPALPLPALPLPRLVSLRLLVPPAAPSAPPDRDRGIGTGDGCVRRGEWSVVGWIYICGGGG